MVALIRFDVRLHYRTSACQIVANMSVVGQLRITRVIVLERACGICYPKNDPLRPNE
jgi:hypothetical protein